MLLSPPWRGVRGSKVVSRPSYRERLQRVFFRDKHSKPSPVLAAGLGANNRQERGRVWRGSTIPEKSWTLLQSQFSLLALTVWSKSGQGWSGEIRRKSLMSLGVPSTILLSPWACPVPPVAQWHAYHQLQNEPGREINKYTKLYWYVLIRNFKRG